MDAWEGDEEAKRDGWFLLTFLEKI